MPWETRDRSIHPSRLVLLFVPLLCVVVGCGALTQSEPREGDPLGDRKEQHRGKTVPVTLHIMSQCPYGVKVVDAMTEIARKVGPQVKLRLEYIGRDG
jgi:hypothetical protein